MSEEDQEKYSGPSIRCVLFELDSEIYGINVKKIREVLRVGSIRKVEGSGYNVLGVINVRGVIVTVVDTRLSYGISPKAIDDLSRIIIVELDDDNIVGMLVDCVLEVKDIPEKQFESMSATKEGASRYLQGIAHFNGNVIILVDVDSMFKV
ncbi:chemotaxis protein CheW [Hydrogenovibrio marinus]|uniref:Chemotaxis protein CheW n=2 Tax=Hydrogenovibrio marinus TaxID=28885 RepID=A0A066ZWS2_HYDMR|nr:chemotaxis protein CheW [Hydrogenovibrio marinus]